MLGHREASSCLRILKARFGRFVAQLQDQLAIDAPRLVLAVAARLAPQQHVNAPVASASGRSES